MFLMLDRNIKLLALLTVIVGIGFFLGLELFENPGMPLLELLFELVEVLPVVLTSVGVALLFIISNQQREEQLLLTQDLTIARKEGERWRNEARTLINGLGTAIEVQFNNWKLTEAESDVGLLILKGLSLKEIAIIRSTSERTIRAQARALYIKAGVSGRAALSAYFLEDLLAPIEDVAS
jgi:DNA-binding CsgD family transcriptional regulator